MGQIKDLLDQIDRLDQQATRSPWGIHQGEYYEVGPLEDDLGDVLVSYGIVEVADLPDAEFIALARTALPALSRAVRAVLKECDRFQKNATSLHENPLADHTDNVRADAWRVMASFITGAIQDALKGADDD